MKSIWKYPLTPDAEQDIMMPAGAKILTVQTQGESPCLWAEVKRDHALEKREIEIYGTGHPMDYGDRRYIGTFQIRSLIWHVYEKLS